MGDFQKTSHHPLIDLAGEKQSVLQKATKPPSDELDGQKLSNFGNAIPIPNTMIEFVGGKLADIQRATPYSM